MVPVPRLDTSEVKSGIGPWQDDRRGHQVNGKPAAAVLPVPQLTTSHHQEELEACPQSLRFAIVFRRPQSERHYIRKS